MKPMRAVGPEPNRSMDWMMIERSEKGSAWNSWLAVVCWISREERRVRSQFCLLLDSGCDKNGIEEDRYLESRKFEELLLC